MVYLWLLYVSGSGDSAAVGTSFPAGFSLDDDEADFWRTEEWGCTGGNVIPDGMPVAGQESDATRPVNIGAVLDRHDRERAEVVVNAVDHPVVAAAGAMQSGKAELERLA